MPIVGETKTHYIRKCPSCGDSSNPNHGHLYIDKYSALYYCMKCGFGGKLTYKTILEYDLDISLFDKSNVEKIEPVYDEIKVVANQSFTKRPTTADVKTAVYHDKLWDYVDITDEKRCNVGKHLRRKVENPTEIKSVTQGNRGIIMPKSMDILSSTEDNPLLIVEGIYDMLTEQSVAICGALNYATISKFFGFHYVVLQPDGDYLVEKSKFLKFYQSVNALLSSKVYVVGLNAIPLGKDIDEIEDEFVLKLTRKQILPFMNYLLDLHTKV